MPIDIVLTIRELEILLAKAKKDPYRCVAFFTRPYMKGIYNTRTVNMKKIY